MENSEIPLYVYLIVIAMVFIVSFLAFHSELEASVQAFINAM